MSTKPKIHSPSGWTMLIFGVLAFFLGLLGILSPNTTLSLLGFETVAKTQRASSDYTLVFLIASSMASFNIGVYYVLAALNDVKKFYLWTVPFRCVTFTVFTISVVTGLAPTRFFLVGLWELTGAIATGVALWYEQQHSHA